MKKQRSNIKNASKVIRMKVRINHQPWLKTRWSL